MNKLASLVCLGLSTALSAIILVNPATAATAGTDKVNVLNIQITMKNGMVDNESEKVYEKAWASIKLDAATRNKINAFNAELDKNGGGYEKYRLTWIRLVNDKVQNLMFQGNRSTIWLYDMSQSNPGSNKCYLTVAGNGMTNGCE